MQPLSDACTEGGLPDHRRPRRTRGRDTRAALRSELADHLQRLSPAHERSQGKMAGRLGSGTRSSWSSGGASASRMGEDRLLEPSQLRAGLEPHFVGEQAGTLAVGRECVDVAPGSVEREHELHTEALVQCSHDKAWTCGKTASCIPHASIASTRSSDAMRWRLQAGRPPVEQRQDCTSASGGTAPRAPAPRRSPRTPRRRVQTPTASPPRRALVRTVDIEVGPMTRRAGRRPPPSISASRRSR